MANAGPVTLNRSPYGAPEYPPAAGDVVDGRPEPGPPRAPFSTPHDYTRCDVTIDATGTLPLGDNGYRLVGWFRRRLRNTSGAFYGAPTPPPSWTLNRPLGGDKPAAPIPAGTRQWAWTMRRTFGVDSGRYPTVEHAGHPRFPRDRSGRRHQPRMRAGFGPNLLTHWPTPGSFGQQTRTAAQASPGPEFVGSGPYG